MQTMLTPLPVTHGLGPQLQLVLRRWGCCLSLACGCQAGSGSLKSPVVPLSGSAPRHQSRGAAPAKGRGGSLELSHPRVHPEMHLRRPLPLGAPIQGGARTEAAFPRRAPGAPPSTFPSGAGTVGLGRLGRPGATSRWVCRRQAPRGALGRSPTRHAGRRANTH